MNALLVWITQKEAARLSPDFAEALAALAHRGRVDQWQHLLDVADQQRVEKCLVDILEVAKEAVFGERGGFVVERAQSAFYLFIERADVRRQKAVQTKKVALVVGESRPFVQPRRIDQADASERNLQRVLAFCSLRWVFHCVSHQSFRGTRSAWNTNDTTRQLDPKPRPYLWPSN